VDTKMESAEPADSRNQTDLTGAWVQQDETKEQEELQLEDDLPGATILEVDRVLDGVHMETMYTRIRAPT
jgi:hypothetical protein